jgi:hypothetical protein
MGARKQITFNNATNLHDMLYKCRKPGLQEEGRRNFSVVLSPAWTKPGETQCHMERSIAYVLLVA